MNTHTIIMTALAQLTQEIREKLPRLMEIENGTYFTHPTYGLCRVVKFDPYYKQIAFLKEKISPVKFVRLKKVVAIIGKEPMLNDVLEFLQGENTHEVTIHIDSRGSFYQFNSKFDDYYPTSFKWELSKPYLKDQSTELIEFLFNLIKK